jgi:hypothetical protein
MLAFLHTLTLLQMWLSNFTAHHDCAVLCRLVSRSAFTGCTMLSAASATSYGATASATGDEKRTCSHDLQAGPGIAVTFHNFSLSVPQASKRKTLLASQVT